ncbi:MAG TPA: DUF4398 domain-containing protein [Spirochaetota bacterium]|nr:DUF4398 domain-containing protein [Spirochaetota bacterium]
MISRKRYTRLIIGALVMLGAGLSCRLDVPIEEMVNAKMKINRAVEVKADTYAPAEIGKARDYLKASHQEVQSEMMDGARTMALKSDEEAQKAIDKSLPLLSADALGNAKKVYAEADMLYASKYSAASFGEADRLIKEADSLHTNKDYWNSYHTSQKALEKAADAKAASLRYVPTVKSEIAGLDAQAADLQSKRGGEFAQSDINAAREKLRAANGKADANNLKEAAPLVEEARTLLGTARANTMRGISAEKLAAAEKSLQQAQASKMKGSFEGDLTRATDLVASSRSLHSSQSYENSIARSDEALTLLNTVSLSMTSRENELREEAQGKLGKAKSGLDEVRNSDLKAGHESELGTAAGHVEAGSRLFVEKDYNGTIRESDSALALLETVKAAGLNKAAGTGEATGTAEAGETGRTGAAGEGAGQAIRYGIDPANYVVKYNPRDRDCLWKIAMYTYRNARLWPLIYSANRDKIRDPDLIFPGQNLVIPVIPERQQRTLDDKKGGGEVRESKSMPAKKDGSPDVK